MDWLSLLEGNTYILVASSGLRNSPCPFESSFPGPLSFSECSQTLPTLPIFLESLNFPSHHMISGHTAGWVTLEQGSAHPVFLRVGSAWSILRRLEPFYLAAILHYLLPIACKENQQDFPPMLLPATLSSILFYVAVLPPVIRSVFRLSVIASTSVHYCSFCVWRWSIDILDNCLMHHLVLIASWKHHQCVFLPNSNNFGSP